MTVQEHFAPTRRAALRYDFDPLAHAQTWLARWDVAPPEELAHECEDRTSKLSRLERVRALESGELRAG